MARYAAAIDQIAQRGRDEFFDRGELRNRAAIEHYLELLGEASGAVGHAVRNANPAIPWSTLARFRFDTAHPYDDNANPVNYEEVWRFACNDLPRIARQLRRVKFSRVGEE